MSEEVPAFATLTGGLGAVAQSGSAPRSHRGGQGFESPQLHLWDLVSDQVRRFSVNPAYFRGWGLRLGWEEFGRSSSPCLPVMVRGAGCCAVPVSLGMSVPGV